MTDETVVAAAALKEAMSQESTDDVMAAVAVRYVEAGLAQTFEARQSSALADKARAIDARFLEALEKVQLAATSDNPKTVLDELIEKNPALLDALRKTDSAPDSPSGDWFNDPEPQPVIWREPEPPPEPTSDEHLSYAYQNQHTSEAYVDAVVSEGEVAVLSAPGGTGKSLLTLALARAASTPESKGGTKHEYGAACGLRVRTGPVMLVSYEDSPVRITRRLRNIAGMGVTQDDPAFQNIRIYRNPEPLFVATSKDDPGKARPSETWDRLWARVRELQPSLVIIDPASAALADISVSEGGPVRLFMAALSTEAQRAACGVLVVAHDTKTARNEARASGDPGAGAIAGSGQWFDSARGILYLYRCRDHNSRILASIKANHGQIHWGARLDEHVSAGRFRGLVLGARLGNAIEYMESDAKSVKPSAVALVETKSGGSARVRPPGKLEDQD